MEKITEVHLVGNQLITVNKYYGNKSFKLKTDGKVILGVVQDVQEKNSKSGAGMGWTA